MDLDIEALHWRLADPRLSDQTRDIVVECALQDLVASVVHEYYFAGKHFFGVGSETFCELLELMLFKLATGSKPVHLFFFYIYFLFFIFYFLFFIFYFLFFIFYFLFFIFYFLFFIFYFLFFIFLCWRSLEDPDFMAIQRWRSMTVDAVFQMNSHIEGRLHEDLAGQLAFALKLMFMPGLAGDCQSADYASIVSGEREALLEMSREARELSYTIRRDIVSCQILVTLAPAGDLDQLGTQGFGLQRLEGSTRTTLLAANTTTLSSLVIEHGPSER
jgi:hypothetical protein